MPRSCGSVAWEVIGMAPFSRKLDRIGSSVINEMVLLAEEYGAINLASGDPEFETPLEIIESAKDALDEGRNTLFETWGALPFREALAEKQSNFMGLSLDPTDNITVTCGSTEAIMASVMAISDPGDRIVTFSPFYEVHTAAPILCGCELAFVPLHYPDQTFDMDRVRHELAQGAKALIICNPSNPSGKVFRLDELQGIADLAQEFDVFVIVDEVYEHFAYPPHEHVYLATLPGMFERTISCGALSKTYSMTGWRLGYTLAGSQISSQIRKVHDYLTLSAAEPLIWGAIAGLEFPESYYEGLQTKYQQLRDLFSDHLDRACLKYIEPEGAFFVMADITPFGFEDDVEFCQWLTKEVGVTAAPGSSFFHKPINRYVRFSFARNAETLDEAGHRLRNAASSR